MFLHLNRNLFISIQEKILLYVLRTGSGDQRATDAEIDALYRDSAFGFKDKELTDFTVDDLDEKTITDYRTYMENMNPGHRYNKLSTEQLLEKLQVVVDGRVTIGGLLVFGNEDNINRLLTDFRVDYLEIMGTSYSDAPTRYNYRLYEEENLFRFYFSIFERLMKKIDLPFTLRADGFATDTRSTCESFDAFRLFQPNETKDQGVP
jgi:ATP-dependent DNA helicase RecG